ncbi:MAG: beta-lactamase family protein [Anaerolineales bacterium]|nr:beta-lactamase family protein [Anaerolineales bacterium]
MQALLRQVDAFIGGKMAAAQTPALALALTDARQTLSVRAYGQADLAAQAPLTPDHLFPIGSIGKLFTAVALLQLHAQRRVDLHAPVTAYLPWFEVGNPFGAPPTLHHLLRNTAGLVAGSDAAPDGRGEVWNLRQTALGFAPGSAYSYSNVGYKILGLVIEAVTGRPYPAVVQSAILDPLGMRQTAPAITHVLRPAMAVGYAGLYDDRPYHPGQPLVSAPWVETDTGDGAIASTAGDMAIFLRALLNGGVGANGPILRPASYRLLLQAGEDLTGCDDWAYGLYRYAAAGSERLFHSCDMPGYMASLAADLTAGLGVVVLMSQPPAYGTPFYPLALLQAWQQAAPLPPPPAEPDPLLVPNALEYAAVYRRGERVLEVAAAGQRLFAVVGGERIPLLRQADDVFYTPHPALDLFLLKFEREAAADEAPRIRLQPEDGAAPPVVALVHGGDWYVNARYRGETDVATPPEWAGYVGHYRSHNPWESNFRVVLVRGGLVLIRPSGESEPLVPLADGSFRVGAAETSPERLRFEALVEGEAWRAQLSGASYDRFFTP